MKFGSNPARPAHSESLLNRSARCELPRLPRTHTAYRQWHTCVYNSSPPTHIHPPTTPRAHVHTLVRARSREDRAEVIARTRTQRRARGELPVRRRGAPTTASSRAYVRRRRFRELPTQSCRNSCRVHRHQHPEQQAQLASSGTHATGRYDRFGATLQI